MPYYLDYALLLTLPYYLPPSVIIRTLPQYILLTRKKNIILNSATLNTGRVVFKSLYSATLNTFVLAPSSAGRGGRTISGKQRIGFGAAAGAQQLYSSITQARSGTATPLNSKAHITARGTFDG